MFHVKQSLVFVWLTGAPPDQVGCSSHRHVSRAKIVMEIVATSRPRRRAACQRLSSSLLELGLELERFQSGHSAAH